jgi:hypothetical protein
MLLGWDLGWYSCYSRASFLLFSRLVADCSNNSTKRSGGFGTETQRLGQSHCFETFVEAYKRGFHSIEFIIIYTNLNAQSLHLFFCFYTFHIPHIGTIHSTANTSIQPHSTNL